MDPDLGCRLLRLLAGRSDLPPRSDLLQLAATSGGILEAGVLLLQLFSRQNFLGPPSEQLTAAEAEVGPERAREVREELARNGESPFHLADALPLLWGARELLRIAHEDQPCKRSLLWNLKAIDVHQKMLDEHSATLREEFLSLLESAGDLFASSSGWPDLALRLAGLNLCIGFFEHRRAEEMAAEARAMAAVEAELSGAQGRRTRFQEEKTQLFLLLTRRRAEEGGGGEALPVDVPLEDDTLLPKIQFSDGPAASPVPLSAQDSAFVLAMAVFHRHSHPMTAVTQEEVLAFLQALLACPADWCVLTEALILRSRMEKGSGRRLQRAMQQMEELAAQFARPEPPFAARAELFPVSRLPARWGLEKEHGQLLLAEGLLKSALDVFLRWEDWPQVINCYVRLGESGSAERVIRARLEQDPDSVPLLCALGDVTGERAAYERAWEASGQRSARAVRSLGFLLCREGRWGEAVPLLEKALSINPLHHGTAFGLGCAALQTEDMERAEAAFRRSTQIEPDDFQAWANLSAVLSRRKQKQKALAVLEEAIRHNYDNWRLWENFIAVGTDCGEFSGVIDALHRLADLRGRYFDAAVVQVLVRAVNEGIEDRHGRSASLLRPRLAELLGRLTAHGGAEHGALRLYSALLRGEAATAADLRPESRRKALQLAQKANAARAEADRGWAEDAGRCAEVAAELADTARFGAECARADADCKAVLRGSRLALKSCLAQLKRNHLDLVTGEVTESLRAHVAELEKLLEEVEDVLR